MVDHAIKKSKWIRSQKQVMKVRAELLSGCKQCGSTLLKNSSAFVLLFLFNLLEENLLSVVALKSTFCENYNECTMVLAFIYFSKEVPKDHV